jgi:hypothetical protein
MTAKEKVLEKLGVSAKVPYPLAGAEIGNICGYHEAMNRIILGLNSKQGWKLEQASKEDVILDNIYKSYIYVEMGDVV